MSNNTKAMIALATLSSIQDALRFLHEHKIISEESISKGCKKFVKDHPEIQEAVDKEFSPTN